MKNWLKGILMVGALGILFSACKKDETRAIFQKGPQITLTSNLPNPFVLLQDDAARSAGVLTWTQARFNYQAAVSYSIQMCKTGTNFAVPADFVEISGGDNFTFAKSFTVSQFNMELIKFLTFGRAASIDVRVKASVGDFADPLYSNVITMNVTPYRALINYSFPNALWIAGNFQAASGYGPFNWTPGNATKIVDRSATPGGDYEGYVFFNEASPEFKMVKGNDWPAGDFGSAGPGALGNGGPNLTISSGAGVYLLKANTTAMTWSATKINKFAVTGSATPLGWPAGPGGTPGQDQTMNFDPATRTYTITLNLTAGELKFRANNDWAINFGDSNNDNIPDFNAPNIAIQSAGNYTITLDLSEGGNYAYLIKKN